ncbi:MAG TPA: hypothetical protein V6C84_22230 [Coleofasciculaceae cyanobacterium]
MVSDRPSKVSSIDALGSEAIELWVRFALNAIVTYRLYWSV